MLGKIGALGGILGPKTDHPLADPKELRRVLAELPTDNAFKVLDEVNGWLESFEAAEDFPPDLLLEVVGQLDEAVQPILRRLGRDYLHAVRQSRGEEKRLLAIVHNAWRLLASSYELCLKRASGKKSLSEVFQSSLPILCGRLIAALGAVNKWNTFNYGQLPNLFWCRLGHACLVAQEAKVSSQSLQLYPKQSGFSSVEQEYLKVMIFQAASMDCLTPFDIELAEKLIAHFVPKFIFDSAAAPDSICWIDLTRDRAPRRMARMPTTNSPTLRFLQPGSASTELEKLVLDLESGREVPSDINLGGQFHAMAVLPVARHLASCLAPEAPQRQHDRHRVRHRMSVLHGLANALVVFSRENAGRSAGLQSESWTVEDVSLGGFGTIVSAQQQPQWLKVGTLLALQPEGGDNWLLGIVRRCRHADVGVRVGIQSLARQGVAVELKSRPTSEHLSSAVISAVMLQDGNEPEELRFVLPMASFDLQENIELERDGRRILLGPVELVEQMADYEVARYRILSAS